MKKRFTGHRLAKAVLAAAMLAGSSAAAVSLGVSPAGATTTSQAPYYLALGDSLSQGVQPNSTGQSVETSKGYVDDLYTLYRHAIPGLQLAKLGCPGETTTTMVKGGVCPYSLGTQLAQAKSFLQSHRTVLVTIDIGANNVDGCLMGGTVNQTCVSDGITAAGTDLQEAILPTLRQAAGPQVPIVAMNYYDPFLALWLQGSAGQALATQSVQLAVLFNGVLGSAYGAFGVPVADVQSAFHTTDFRTAPFSGLPLNVTLICAWTWMCAPAPVGPNIHANTAGYWVIALAFLPRIGFL